MWMFAIRALRMRRQQQHPIFNEFIGNGRYDALNKFTVTVAGVNGFVAILIGETLSNNTDLPDDKASGSATTRRIVGTSHYVLVTVTVIAAAFVAWRESGLTQKLCKGQHLRSPVCIIMTFLCML
ncbi:hypothetical protein FOXG_21463 [Fusarium oxysporum f. sp. lycopersici 4287]|uniref:Uncharacterized protein n=1 Tax=Fusarium oxysporum f. sp. lycopersici (strain 4287 / CBS 123668 / FGSC 9935 / NRRL 34936) TaxID=426428 RepID=A0A0J9VXR7_FUSO4|nr:hypothetical protein FOXG_21463 [Fusarium oxysporum f. sp. lycopersici 4287]EWZ77435.1 hypothetical protein FOWG_18157 [Fusarium oxysporum f. sp. lycopersici MN25]KAJ9413506.1 hypothetical protein QL093DRAFT_2024983 [Fusarium oxysporum]KNB15749.1 hypothetical protein FOXG_21463 [Fusarium oxysporum f. sp. lycopersici 4287]